MGHFKEKDNDTPEINCLKKIDEVMKTWSTPRFSNTLMVPDEPDKHAERRIFRT